MIQQTNLFVVQADPPGTKAHHLRVRGRAKIIGRKADEKSSERFRISLIQFSRPPCSAFLSWEGVNQQPSVSTTFWNEYANAGTQITWVTSETAFRVLDISNFSREAFSASYAHAFAALPRALREKMSGTMFKVEAVVVGAGVIGLAIARALALRGVQVLLLEKESVIGSGTSSRNSEVIHAGLYYEPESLKALLCVRGRRMLYRYCDERGVPHRQCGKLVVATDPSEDAYLDHLRQQAEKNEVEEIELIGAARLKRLEPHVRGTRALLSACSGIIDSHALMLSYQADVEAAGGTIVFRTPVLGATIVGRTIQLRTGGSESAELEADLVVNAAGLYAWDFSAGAYRA